MKKILSKVVSWVAKKVYSTDDSKVVPVVSTDNVYSLVQNKMKAMETEAITARIRNLEKLVTSLTQHIIQVNQENVLQRELLLHTSTNVEELLNAFSEPVDDSDDDDMPSAHPSKLSLN